MELSLGENLKRMRKSRNITQEELAEILGVTFQSVSRWERGDCYPDITLLPGLANFFDVSVDALLGMDAIRSKSHKNGIFKMAHEYMDAGNYRKAADVYRQALKIYPDDDGPDV